MTDVTPGRLRTHAKATAVGVVSRGSAPRRPQTTCKVLPKRSWPMRSGPARSQMTLDGDDLMALLAGTFLAMDRRAGDPDASGRLVAVLRDGLRSRPG